MSNQKYFIVDEDRLGEVGDSRGLTMHEMVELLSQLDQAGGLVVIKGMLVPLRMTLALDDE